MPRCKSQNVKCRKPSLFCLRIHWQKVIATEIHWSSNQLSNLELPVEKFFNRSNSTINQQDKIELALKLYSLVNRTPLDKMEYRLELDASIRWCTLLMEQNDTLVSWICCTLLIFCVDRIEISRHDQWIHQSDQYRWIQFRATARHCKRLIRGDDRSMLMDEF